MGENSPNHPVVHFLCFSVSRNKRHSSLMNKYWHAMDSADQGCQIFLGTLYQNGGKYTKWPQNIPNDHKIYQMTTKYTKWPQNIPNGHKVYQMAVIYLDKLSIMYTNIFHSNVLQKLLKFGFLVWKYICHLATLP
jgi:hypothetical protein